MARECGPPSWVLHIGTKCDQIFSFDEKSRLTWVARIRGP